jgi:hypothetical protein
LDFCYRYTSNGGVVSPDISPVDEMPDVSQLQLNQQAPRSGSRAAAATSIPVRRENKRNQVAALAAGFIPRKSSDYGDGVKNKKLGDTRWDSLTGEPTTNARGKPPQVKPGEFVPPGNSMYDTAVDSGLGLRTTGTVPPRSQNSFGERMKKLRDNTLMSGGRPEWKGSSGRAQIVPPVTDQPNLPPLSIPRKSSKRATSPRNITSGESTPLSTILSDQGESESGLITPTLQTVAGRRSPPRFIESPTSVAANSNFAMPGAFSAQPEPVHHLRKHSVTASFSQYSEDDGPVTPTQNNQNDDSVSIIERHFREALKGVNFPAESRDQPISRWSVTTRQTASTSSSPRESMENPPPVPPLPAERTPVVNRRRPKVSNSFDSSKATIRKAVPSSPVFISMSTTNPNPAPHVRQPSSQSKMLPKSPPEAQSVDLVSSLQAQLDNLAHRRKNLQRSIHQMTELMPDVLMSGMEARRQAEEKKKVEGLREELADVVRAEHDVGLRLHRALKRRDRNDIYEPTGLWVRRVTG